MKVGELIDKLKDYDPEKEILFMKERDEDDITYADSIDEVQQRVLAKDYFEYRETPAVVLIHKILNNNVGV